jgi:thiol:disulfide interchange protein DsbG
MLHAQVKFVWLPVAFLGPKSLPQGAALLQSPQPLEAMSAHERSLLAGEGGSAASASIPAEIEAAIQANTQLLNRLGAESVPFVVARHRSSGQVLTHAGAMGSAELAGFLGLN